MKVVICGNVINAKKILLITPVMSTTNSAHDVYQAFTIVFLNNKPLQINAFSLGGDGAFLSKDQLEGMRTELIEIWSKSMQNDLHVIQPPERKSNHFKQ